LINYQNIARIRREVENILLLIDELEAKGLPKGIIIDIILNESQKPNKENECTGKDK